MSSRKLCQVIVSSPKLCNSFALKSTLIKPEVVPEVKIVSSHRVVTKIVQVICAQIYTNQTGSCTGSDVSHENCVKSSIKKIVSNSDPTASEIYQNCITLFYRLSRSIKEVGPNSAESRPPKSKVNLLQISGSSTRNWSTKSTELSAKVYNPKSTSKICFNFKCL